MSGATQLEFGILGPLEVRADGAPLALPRKKQRALLALLLLRAGEWLSADALIEALWSERPPPTARAALHNYVAQLRRALGPELIVSRDGGYRLELASEQLDLATFERLVGEARDEQGDERRRHLQQALALWRGPALADVVYESFAAEEAARLEELHVSAHEELVDAELAAGGGPDLVEQIEALIAEHPYHERLRGQLMLALYRAGRQVEALECYRQARATLSEELGIEPGSALRELEQAILRQDPSLDPAAPELAAAAPLAQRRKLVTVLFAELGFLAELDPELLRQASARALGRVRTILEEHGGSIEQRATDELLAVFGLPQGHEDDALRAARAALELQAGAGEAELRLALESGEVLAGVDEAGHGFVSGAVVPLAKKLLERASAGEILVGRAALDLLHGAALTAEKRGGASRLVRVEEEPLAIASPLIDRRQELTRLKATFAEVVDERRTRLVLLLGEAGVGKTRLAAELAGELEGAATIARGRCLSYGQALSYWPLVDALRALGAPAREALERLLSGGATSPRQLAWAVEQALVRAAAERPVLLMLEDLHWAEPSLLELLGRVAALRDDAPILLLCLARSELLDDHPDWAQRESLRLGPLPRADAAALLEALAQPPMAGDRERVLARAAGNPLFLEELGAFLAQGGGEHELPPRIQVLLQARLDLLPEPQRLLLATAAVEGAVFHRGALEELMPDETELEKRLAALAETLLIRPCPGELEGELGYRFRHELIRDTAYGALPKRERARLHERFADWLARHRGGRGELDDIVAHHLERAALARRELQAADPALERRAAEALAAAAERATLLADYPAAVDLWRRSLALLAEDDPAVASRELELAVTLAALGRREEANALFVDAEQRAADPCLSGHIRIARLNARLNFEPEGMPAAIRRECERVIPLFEEHGDHRALSRAWQALGQVEWCETQMQAADRAMATAAEHAQRAGDRALEVFTLVSRAAWLGTTRWSTSETRRELERLTARFPGEPVAERGLRFWRVFTAFQEGRTGDARAGAREWLDDVRRHDSPMMAESFAMFFALNELLTGDIERAERLALEAVEALEDCGVRAFLGSAKSVLAEVRVAQGRAREAVELAEESVRIGSPADRVNLVAAHAVKARAYAMLGEDEQAKAAAAEAVAVAGQTDALLCWAVAQKALAQALLAAGELPAAHAAAVEAERLFGTLERFLTQQPATALVAQIERELAAAGAPA